MLLKFYKYQGTGNDFVMLEDAHEKFDAQNITLVAHLCDRRLGIGADGLILIRPHDTLAFEMLYFNADGRLGTMCGNGGRCAAHFAHFLEYFEKEGTFLAADGEHHAIVEQHIVTLSMQAVEGIESLSLVSEHPEAYFLDTGSPHYVSFVEDVAAAPLCQVGEKVRHHAYFAQRGGTNVNLVERIADQEIRVRTFERGVEDETLSCGTGVTACALVAAVQGSVSPVTVHTKGGTLEVGWQNAGERFEQIYLKGSVVQVFEGFLDVKKSVLH